MKILFVVQEHPADPFGGMTTFVKNYLQEIRKSCEVVSVFLIIIQISILYQMNI